MTAFSPLMLTLARESRRLSQTALAAACQPPITQATISNLESGTHQPTPGTLAVIAGALGCPESLFAATPHFHHLPPHFFRRRKRLGIRDVNAIRARVNLFRFRIELLLRSQEVSDPRIAFSDLERAGETPAQAAQRVRLHWNIPDGPLLDLTSIVESAGVIIVPLDFGTALVDGLGLYSPVDHLPPLIFMNPGLPADRWRFTLAHELGHIVMHHHLATPRDPDLMEDEAHEFAAELLLPKRAIWGQLAYLSMMNLGALKRTWRVSMAAVLKRAADLDRISSVQERRLWMQLRRDGMAEPIDLPAESPSALRRIVEDHLQHLGYTARSLSEVLHQNIEEFRSDFLGASSGLRLTQ